MSPGISSAIVGLPTQWLTSPRSLDVFRAVAIENLNRTRADHPSHRNHFRSALGVLITQVSGRASRAQATLGECSVSDALMLLPGALLVYLSFNAGGSFPGSPALVAVLLALALATSLALRLPPDRCPRSATGLLGAFAAYTVWVLVSATWSHAPERALIKAELPLLYGLGFALFAALARGPHDMRWVLRGLAAGTSAVCLGSFLSRALPAVWPIPAALATDDRVSYPLTYQNTLGFLAVIGILLCVGLTSDGRESRSVQFLSAIPVPLLAATLLLTFSRGAIVVGLIGLVAYIAIGRPQGLLPAAVALLPTTALAVVATYEAPLLAHRLVGTAAQAGEGHRVTLIVVVCMIAAGLVRRSVPPIDVRRLRLSRYARRPSRSELRGAGAIGAGLIVAASVALGLPGRVTREYQRFARSDTAGASSSPTGRLTNLGSDGRVAIWRVAGHEFEQAPLRGSGAGTYEVFWNARQPASAMTAAARPILYAHSIYLESLAELGLVGMALLMWVIVGSLIAIGRRIRGPNRTLYATAFTVALAWSIQAGFDWDWETPAVTLPIFVLAGVAVGRAGPPTRLSDSPRHLLFVSLALVAAVIPALIGLSQRHLDAGLADFKHRDCAAATSQAQAALAPLSFRTGAQEIIAYCGVAGGQMGPALAEIKAAIRDDPANWEPRYGLAIVMAIAGEDPRPAAREALALSPFQPLNAGFAAKLGHDPSSLWANDAESAQLSVAGQLGPAMSELGARLVATRVPAVLTAGQGLQGVAGYILLGT